MYFMMFKIEIIDWLNDPFSTYILNKQFDRSTQHLRIKNLRQVTIFLESLELKKSNKDRPCTRLNSLACSAVRILFGNYYGPYFIFGRVAN